MRLFIAEKPELGRAIAQGLGGGAKKEGYIRCGDDVVTWCFGHLLELCEPEDYDPAYQRWRLEDLPIVPIPWRYKPRPGAQKQLDRVLKLLQQTDTVVHAGDPDEEGQLLVEEVLRHAQNAKPVQRLLINDLTPTLVQKALGQLRDNTDFEGLYQAALARSVADQLYGFNMTRAYTLTAQRQGHGGVLSVGRVQTPILGLVVNRDRQHEGHAKRDYFVLTATVEVEGLSLQAGLVPPQDAPTDDKGRVTDEAWLQTLAAACDGQTATVCRATTTAKTTPAPLPYNLLTLQAGLHTRILQN